MHELTRGTACDAASVQQPLEGYSSFASAGVLRATSWEIAEDVFEELDKFGEIENLNICDNLADHMVGSVYVKFKDENDAARAMQVAHPSPSPPRTRMI